jgi:hypothetical protein
LADDACDLGALVKLGSSDNLLLANIEVLYYTVRCTIGYYGFGSLNVVDFGDSGDLIVISVKK